MYPTKSYFLVLLGVYLCLEIYQAKEEFRCEFAAFIENEDGSDPRMIDRGVASIELHSCAEDSQKECSSVVAKEIEEGTKNGNFSVVVDEKDQYTIGDVLCDKADVVQEDVRNKWVAVHWRLCKSEWSRTSFRMPRPLCCEDGLYVPCDKFNKKSRD